MECKRGKEKVPTKEENLNTMRRVRIVYSDPDATDYSSEEDDGFLSNGNQLKGCTKRVVKEILFPCMPSKLHAENSSQEDVNNSEKIKASSGPFASKRNRKPSSGVRMWQGTFDTEEEAAMAYEKKKSEIERDALACESAKEVLFHASPSSVLDVSTTKAPLEVNDSNDLVKEKVNVETKGEVGGIDVEAVKSEDGPIQQLLEEPILPTLVGHDLYLDELEKGAMMPDNDFYHFLDNDMKCDSMWNVEHEESIILPPVDSDFDELAWIDETLNSECT